ncbi:hypothetical protein DU508_12740 [Pedobacter chinensis]|uniref:Uncharacterized protein n=1 Tax=Pedobacter chinensis TaxID=2282421 RepID=A0A369PV48_9SPHI|nr:hypothetical protein DU508_12740 [Pedobacter chinensis]
MRKTYALLKQYALALTLLTVISLIVHSCKKDRNNPIEEDHKTTLKIGLKTNDLAMVLQECSPL